MSSETWGLLLITVLGYIASWANSRLALKAERQRSDVKIESVRADGQAQLQASHNASQAKLEEYRVTFAQQEREAYERHNAFFFDQFQKTQVRLDETNSSLAASQATITNQQEQLKEARTASAERDRQIGELRARDEQKGRDNEKLHEELVQSKAEQGRQAIQITELLERQTELLQRQKERHDQINEWMSEMAQQKEELDRAKVRITELENENACIPALKTERDALRQQIDALIAERDALIQQLGAVPKPDAVASEEPAVDPIAAATAKPDWPPIPPEVPVLTEPKTE